MNAHVVIVTGKRIICVDELRSNQLDSTDSARKSPGQKIISGLDKIIPGGVRRNNQARGNIPDAVIGDTNQPEQVLAGGEQDKIERGSYSELSSSKLEAPNKIEGSGNLGA